MRSSLFLLGVGLALSVACSSSSESPDDTDNGAVSEPLAVVATTTQIGDFARNVGGKLIELTVLLGPNQDAHDFALEPSQIRAVTEADIVLRNGLGLDNFLDSALENSSGAVAVVSAGIETREGGHDHEDDDHEDGHERKDVDDPHVWFSVTNARVMVENIRDALIAEDSANAVAYRDSATAYLAELAALDVEIRDQIETIPDACRKLVTNHDVLGYYATEYGLEVIGTVIPSTSSAAQASAADVAEIVTLIQAENIPAIFAEASANPDLIQQVGREAGVTVVDDLYGDSLGPAGSDGATYAGMMRANTESIAAALSNCDA